MQKKIVEVIKKAIVKLGVKENIKIELSVPPKPEMGDFAFGCFPLAQSLEKSPVEIAKELKGAIEELKTSKNLRTSDFHPLYTGGDFIEYIQTAGPYINFILANEYFVEMVKHILKVGDNWGKVNLLNGKIFLSEHTDPNLFKEFHIGHMMTNSIGESLSRIADFVGAEVKQVTFQGDVGLHVAKTLYGMMNKKSEMPDNEMSVWEKQEFLGRCYAWGEKQYSTKKTIKAKEAIVEINKKVYSKEDKEQNKLYEIGKKWSLEYFDEIYKLIGSHFDYYFLESETFTDGKRLVEENIGKIFQKSKGAVIFPGSKYGLHDRVFINSEGLPTYEAKDIGLFYKKWEKYNPDISLTITDGEQKQYFEVVKKAAGMINKKWEEKTVHLAHGTLRLKSGKMSSRTGDIIRAKKWVEDTADVVAVKMKKDDKQIAKKIAIAAIKYSILKVQAGKDIVYNQDEALSFEGDTGPYLQYTYVRAMSILKKIEGIDFKNKKENVVSSNIPMVGKTVLKFPEIVNQAFLSYSPHHIATYLHKLASEFNSFYAQTRILDRKNSNYIYNILLTKSIAQTLKNGLYLLGIEVVEEM